MKKVVLIVGIVLAFTGAVTAQTTTKVSKQIKMLPWLNTAVIDANDAAGGLHTYADWTTLSSNLKTSEIQIGMLVSITADKATYRLKSWTTTTALPLYAEWERVGDAVVVADIAARDALLAGTSAGVLSIGTTVIVKDNGSGLVQSYIYTGGGYDFNGDGVTNTADNWYSVTNTAGSGFIYFDQVAPSTTAVTSTKGWDGDGASASLTATSKKLTSIPATTQFALTLGGTTVPQIAVPAAWPNPVFYLNDGTNTTLLTDLWVKSSVTLNGITYQVWVADWSFLKDATGTFNLLVR